MTPIVAVCDYMASIVVLHVKELERKRWWSIRDTNSYFLVGTDIGLTITARLSSCI